LEAVSAVPDPEFMMNVQVAHQDVKFFIAAAERLLIIAVVI
jgi:hypothetical protein